MTTDLNILGEKAREAAAQLVRLGTEDKNRGLFAAAEVYFLTLKQKVILLMI